MATKKFYAVKKGLTPGIYTNWPDCQAQISGYSGAIYKGFATKEEAMAFLGGDLESFGQQGLTTISFEKDVHKETKAVAYVDGSYDITTGNFSYGMVFFHDGKEEHFSKKFEGSDIASMRNVAGEIQGARAAMELCLERNIESLTIYHDYIGIAAWCTGEWKANKEGTMDYALFYRAASLKVAINFVKVKGHSGDKYNELADKLAKEALGI